MNQLSEVYLRVKPEIEMAPVLISEADAGRHIGRFIEDLNREAVLVVGLDTKNRVIIDNIVSIGRVDAAMHVPAEIFKPLLLANASRFIVGHVHPSGNTTPSSADIHQFKVMRTLADLMGMPMLDHIIVSRGNYQSIQDFIEEHGDEVD